jgi:predicted dithiol-disulfide oxidoreductase (DUF899 family)
MKASSPALCHLHFPGESVEYRGARNALLAEEMELRRRIERVASQRRALPAGGAIPEDYEFEGDGGLVKLSELFAFGKDTLAIYSFMYGPERERPCPGCTHFLDALDGETEHILQRINLAVVAKSPLPRIIDFAKERGWHRLRLLSTAGNSNDSDYFGDSTGLAADIRVQQEFKAGEEWDMPPRRQNDPSLLGFGNHLRAARAWPGVSPQRCPRSALEYARPLSCRTW